MKVWQLGISCLALVLLVGCKTLGLGGKPVDYGAGATQAPSLEVPPDLTMPAGEGRYRVPQGDDEGVATYSDYSKGGAAAPRARGVAVLPEVKGVRLERSGTQRWLAVNDKPENVWTVIKAFLQENGFPIKSEDQAAGAMETDWVESRIDIPQDGVRGVLGKIFDKAHSSGERNQYRVRLERGKEGGTEVYITHRGMEEVFSEDKSTSKWQARPSDPEMEAVMLQRLMVRFGGGEARAPGKTGGAPGTVGVVTLQETPDGGRIVVVNDTFDRSWRRVGLAIERAGLAVEDKDRARGIYFLRPPKADSGWLDKLQFWKDSKKTATRYRVNVKDGGAASEVSVTDQDGASDDVSRQMIEAIYKNIAQGENGAKDARQGAGGAAPASVSAINATGPAGTASLQEIFDGSLIIMVNDEFERSWRRVGIAMERAGLAAENNDRAKGIYFLRTAKAESGWLDKLQFWRDSENTNTRYRVNVKDGGKACEVAVTDPDGASDDAARQMTEAIYRNISQ